MIKTQSAQRYVICHQCGQRHEATYSHEGRWGQGAIFAVVCTEDHLTDYYTTELLFVLPLHTRS